MSQCFQFEPHPLTRRELLERSSVGFAGLALAALLGDGARGDGASPLAERPPHYAVENKVHFHDLHATILRLLGLDHERMTYRWGGRDFRLTDVHGRVVEDIVT